MSIDTCAQGGEPMQGNRRGRRFGLGLSGTFVLCALMSGCGGTPSAHRAGVALTAASIHSSPDNDSDRDDGDDDIAWGKPADASELAAVTALVKRYYALAAAGDGSNACQLIYSAFAKEIPELYGDGAPALRGDTCAAVMSKIFKQHHLELTEKRSRLTISAVRVRGERGIAVLRFIPTSGHAFALERQLPLYREHGAWTVYGLLDAGLI
jgi:hypothetical protein